MEYSNYVSVSLVANELDLLTADEYREQQAIIGGTHVLSDNSIDWQEAIFRPATSHNHNLSFRGGTKLTNYAASIGVLDQEGIIKNNKYTRYNAKLNINSKFLNEKLELGLGILASHVDNAGVPVSSSGNADDLLLNTIRANPTA